MKESWIEKKWESKNLGRWRRGYCNSGPKQPPASSLVLQAPTIPSRRVHPQSLDRATCRKSDTRGGSISQRANTDEADHRSWPRSGGL